VELERIALRVLFAYVLLHQLLRYAGKRAISSGQGAGRPTGIDFLLTLIVGDLIDDLLWAEVPAAEFVAAAGTLVLLHVAVAGVRYATPVAWRLIEGAPRQVLRDGEPLRPAMRRERLNEKALAAMLRGTGLDRGRWGEVRAAYLENTGMLGVLRRPSAKPATRADRDRLPDNARRGSER
jgi:uncharacterized membrane protein YcaP (DUF421 family)